MAVTAQTMKETGPLPLFARARVKLSCATAARFESVYGGSNSRQAEARPLLKAPITLLLLLVTQIYQAQLFSCIFPFTSPPTSSHLGLQQFSPIYWGSKV